MGALEEGLRHFWLRDIHLVTGVTKQGLRQWLEDEDFIVTRVNRRDDFVIRVLVPNEAKRSLAHDSTTMASAAFETMLGIDRVAALPKSAGWIVIRAYYAAFYAAHSLLRMMGTSCIQLDHTQIQALNHVANALGLQPPNGFEAGSYIVSYDALMDEMGIRKTAASKRSSHDALWDVFSNKLREISNPLLQVSSRFNVWSLQLTSLENQLRQEGQSAGGWLSYVRNRANYRHDFGIWHPYSGSRASAANLIKIARRWNAEPDHLLPVPKADSITIHVWLCTIIVAICYAMIRDIEAHTPGRKSFHSYRSLALVRMVS